MNTNVTNRSYMPRNERNDDFDCQPSFRSNGGGGKKPVVQPAKKPSFTVDDQIHVSLDINLAIALGHCLVDNDNKALAALGFQLLKLDNEPESEYESA